jgi:hypothetical protein
MYVEKICGKERKKLRKRPAYLQKRETTAHEVLYLIQLILAYLFINIWGHHDHRVHLAVNGVRTHNFSGDSHRLHMYR